MIPVYNRKKTFICRTILNRYADACALGYYRLDLMPEYKKNLDKEREMIRIEISSGYGN